MKTVTIELIDGYFIEVDELNHTLKQRYQGDTKDGKKKSAERIIGYYPSVRACVERIVKLILLDEDDGKVFLCVSMLTRLKKPLREFPS